MFVSHLYCTVFSFINVAKLFFVDLFRCLELLSYWDFSMFCVWAEVQQLSFNSNVLFMSLKILYHLGESLYIVGARDYALPCIHFAIFQFFFFFFAYLACVENSYRLYNNMTTFTSDRLLRATGIPQRCSSGGWTSACTIGSVDSDFPNLVCQELGYASM